MNALIVEEDVNHRKLLRLTLEHHGCTAIEAQDGLDGLDQAIHHHPDIILSNTLMPRMDGFQLLWALKTDPKLTSIPILLYSDTNMGEQETKLALTLGASAFVVNQGDPEELWKQASLVMLSSETRPRAATVPETDKNDSRLVWEYSRIIAAKLEEKVRELEKALTQRRQDASELRDLNAQLRAEIVEHQRAEEAVRQQERELAAIFELAPFPMLLLDGARRIRRANGYASTLVGSEAMEMVGQRGGEALRCLQALDTPEGCGFGEKCRHCTLHQAIIHTLETGQSRHGVEAHLPLSGGYDVSSCFRVSTAKVTPGERDMVLVSLQDITEQKRLEQLLRHSRKQESLAILGNGFVHELNTLMTSIVGYGDATLLRMPPDTPHRQGIETMVKAAHASARMTHEYLSYGSMLAPEKTSIDLNECISPIGGSPALFAPHRSSCTAKTTDGPLPILADAHQIELLVTHLANCAQENAPWEGSFTIATARISIDNDFIEANGFGRSGHFALLSVASGDTGIRELPRQIRLEPCSLSANGGTRTNFDLSVAICIARQHDGFIGLMDRPGMEAAYLAFLPLAEAEPDRAGTKAGPTSGERGKQTILLAEDDESVRNMAQAVLQHFGYDVIVAVDGEDAVSSFREHGNKISLLLFDLVMPKKNGREAYEEIKRLKPDIKVLFASGFVPEITRQRLVADRNESFILKPYLPSLFLQKVRAILEDPP